MEWDVFVKVLQRTRTHRFSSYWFCIHMRERQRCAVYFKDVVWGLMSL